MQDWKCFTKSVFSKAICIQVKRETYILTIQVKIYPAIILISRTKECISLCLDGSNTTAVVCVDAVFAQLHLLRPMLNTDVRYESFVPEDLVLFAGSMQINNFHTSGVVTSLSTTYSIL